MMPKMLEQGYPKPFVIALAASAACWMANLRFSSKKSASTAPGSGVRVGTGIGARGIVGEWRKAQILIVDAFDPDKVRGAADVNIGPGSLRGAFFQIIKRLDHGYIPSGLFSNMVWRLGCGILERSRDRVKPHTTC